MSEPTITIPKPDAYQASYREVLQSDWNERQFRTPLREQRYQQEFNRGYGDIQGSIDMMYKNWTPTPEGLDRFTANQFRQLAKEFEQEFPIRMNDGPQANYAWYYGAHQAVRDFHADKSQQFGQQITQQTNSQSFEKETPQELEMSW